MLVKTSRFMLLMLIFILIPISSLRAEDDTPKIRVALDRWGVSSAFRVTDGNYTLIDSATGLTIGTPAIGEKWSLTLNGTNITVNKETQLVGSYAGPIILKPNGNGLNVFSFNNVQYRDMLTYEIVSNSLLAVNTVGIDKYLYGVIGKEMGYGAPDEALKTQAVVSRSFALSAKGSSLKYDVTNDTSSQVFGGYSAELITGSDRVKKAVDETAGEVIYYYDVNTRKNIIIRAYFHANSGGYTEDSENVWNAPLQYIKAVASPYDEKGPEYSYKWTKTFTKDELQKQIETWNNLAQARNQSYNVVDVGEISGLYAFSLKDDGVSPTQSGRVTRMDIVGSKGTKSFLKDAIRSVLGLKSTKFTVEADSSLYVLGSDVKNVQQLSEANLYAANRDSVIALPVSSDENMLHVIGRNGTKLQQQGFTSITLKGYGYGHGLGMSQWGARGMANEGYNYKEIIEHYYNQDKNDGRLTVSKNY